jgi:hypothetical protein
VQKRGFFAGGRGDFLAGQKRGFLGSRESRASGAASCENRSQSPRGASSPSVFEEDVRFSRIGSYRKSNYVSLNRHSELSERTESSIIHLLFLTLTLICFLCYPAQRGLQRKQP